MKPTRRQSGTPQQQHENTFDYDSGGTPRRALAIAGDGQVTLDKTIVKHGARKVRKVSNGRVLAGFAGSAADGITLLEKFEGKFTEYKESRARPSSWLKIGVRTGRCDAWKR